MFILFVSMVKSIMDNNNTINRNNDKCYNNILIYYAMYDSQTYIYSTIV